MGSSLFAELNIHSNRIVTLSSFKKYDDGTGCAHLKLISGRFSYWNNEFYFDDLVKFVQDLRIIYKTLKGCAELRLRYESEYIKFEAKSFGHIELSGEFIEYGNIQQTLNIGFELDQSYLPDFIAQLETIIKEIYC